MAVKRGVLWRDPMADLRSRLGIRLQTGLNGILARMSPGAHLGGSCSHCLAFIRRMIENELEKKKPKDLCGELGQESAVRTGRLSI